MLFQTKAGPVRLRWSDQGLRAIELPELPPREVRALLAKEEKEGVPVPAFVRQAARTLTRHLGGVPQDLLLLPLDLSGLAPFQRAVYEALRAHPPGTTLSYGELAVRMGKPGASRAVGQALGKNPFLLAVPCHRVLGADGAPGGFSAPGGVLTKQRLLALEGVKLDLLHGLPFDPEEAVRHLSRRDKKLAKVIARAGPYTVRPEKAQSTFEGLLRSIVYQQLNGKAAATILGRVVALTSKGRTPRPEDLASVSDAELRAAGLSGSKTAAVRDLAAKTLDGTVPPFAKLKGMTDDEIVERLTAVRGIGPWTVQMLLMFRLGRPDVLPVADYGVRKGFSVLQGMDDLPTPAQLTEAGEQWRPYRSVASWYLWRILDF